MLGANCSIYGCSSSRKSKGCSIFKLPAPNNDFNKKWRGDLLNVIRKDRVVDDSLKRQIDADRLHICERHFSDYQSLIPMIRQWLHKPEMLQCMTLDTLLQTYYHLQAVQILVSETLMSLFAP